MYQARQQNWEPKVSCTSQTHQKEHHQRPVIEHVLSRLKDIGITKIFGVPGDYAFAVEDAIVNFPGIEWVGCCNELNAAYAADGYARVNGIGAVNTTYGVGELSAICAIAGSFAESLPVFHLVGMPSVPMQAARATVHHTLGAHWLWQLSRFDKGSVSASQG